MYKNLAKELLKDGAQVALSNFDIPGQNPTSTAWTINYAIIK